MLLACVRVSRIRVFLRWCVYLFLMLRVLLVCVRALLHTCVCVCVCVYMYHYLPELLRYIDII